MSKKIRLDLHLLTLGLVASRQQAQQLIRAGKVRDMNGQLLDKPGQEVPEGLELDVKEPPRFVSRGGEKLLGAFNSFSINLEGRVCIDCGISTGGFTDCLLQHGASRVYGIDVGYGQIAWKLRNDSRVVLFERTNLRTLKPEVIYKSNDCLPDFAVADLSFISLRLVVKAITSLVKPKKSESIVLIKPQFEVGKERVGKKGVVRDPAAHIDVLNRVIEAFSKYGWKPKGLIPSPLKGPAGNHEYLLWLGMDNPSVCLDIQSLVSNTLS